MTQTKLKDGIINKLQELKIQKIIIESMNIDGLNVTQQKDNLNCIERQLRLNYKMSHHETRKKFQK